MSDLISRNELIEEIKSLQITFVGKNIFLDEVKDTILRTIDEQPTAYNIDKVVEELEKERMRLSSASDDCCSVGNFSHAEIYSEMASCFYKAIESVKHGGVADDVCEWKYGNNYPYYTVGCRANVSIPIKYGRFCPYCGKKIKVVD